MIRTKKRTELAVRYLTQALPLPDLEAKASNAELIGTLLAHHAAIGTLKLCPEWTYSCIRHGQRNMDFGTREGFDEPDRQCGGSIAQIVNLVPAIITALSATGVTGWREEGHEFKNRVRSLFNIDGFLLPELTAEQQGQFVRDPVRYFIGTDKAQSEAIWREVEKRQVRS